MGEPTKFIFLTDLHWGYERRNGHKYPLHDEQALSVAMEFAQDFQPDVVILGGDILDCGAISHHNKNKPGRTEGLRLLSDAQELNKNVIEPINELIPDSQKVYILGNHEDWLTDLEDDIPGIQGLLGIQKLLSLTNWTIIPQGKHFNLGKLTFVHGDQLKGGEHIAKAAVTNYERSIRFGHHHTFQTYTKTSAIDCKFGKTGIAVPCLASKDPRYNEGKPNRWAQGFNFGYVFRDGTYSDYVSIIINGRTVINGKVYDAK